jgi:hypothetical protein
MMRDVGTAEVGYSNNEAATSGAPMKVVATAA